MRGVLPINQLIFLSDKLIEPATQRLLNIPLHFITFAHIDGMLFNLPRNTGTFVSREGNPHGNNVVYGALFLLQDFGFHIRTLDSMSLCSLSTLRRNHSLDTQHRVTVQATPISFSSIDELERLLYVEGEPINVHTYIGNLNHPKINHRVANRNRRYYRITDGINADSFLQLYREVNK